MIGLDCSPEYQLTQELLTKYYPRVPLHKLTSASSVVKMLHPNRFLPRSEGYFNIQNRAEGILPTSFGFGHEHKRCPNCFGDLIKCKPCRNRCGLCGGVHALSQVSRSRTLL